MTRIQYKFTYVEHARLHAFFFCCKYRNSFWYYKFVGACGGLHGLILSISFESGFLWVILTNLLAK